MHQNTPSLRDLEQHDAFVHRHIGPNDEEIAQMLRTLGFDSLEAMTDAIVPSGIKSAEPLALPPALTEQEALARIRAIAAKNRVFPQLHRPGLLRHAHAAGDPAQHPREPGLVHRLHALSGGFPRGAWRR